MLGARFLAKKGMRFFACGCLLQSPVSLFTSGLYLGPSWRGWPMKCLLGLAAVWLLT